MDKICLGDKFAKACIVKNIVRGRSGNVDVKGLREIGWEDKDIDSLQNYVWWENYSDEQFLVSDYDKQIWTECKEYSDWDGERYNRVRFLPLLDTSNVTDINNAFYNCTALTTIPLLDISNVTRMYITFCNCTALTTIPLLDISNVNSMIKTFHGCTALTSIPSLDTSSVTNMDVTFYNCTALTTIPLLDISNVTRMYITFCNCTALTTIPLLDTSSVINMNATFQNCTALTTIPLLDISSATNMDATFYNCTALTTCNLKNIKTSLSLSTSPLLAHESIMYIINNAQVVTGKTLTLGATNLAKLTAEEIAIATSKGWTVN